jgi:hypothetical protein
MANRRFAAWGDATLSVYKVDMNSISPWLIRPADAYRAWQATEAAGADRRPFSARSITQHSAMFDRFLRHLVARGVTVATFGADHLESFFADVENRCTPGTTTRLRYASWSTACAATWSNWNCGKAIRPPR